MCHMVASSASAPLEGPRGALYTLYQKLPLLNNLNRLGSIRTAETCETPAPKTFHGTDLGLVLGWAVWGLFGALLCGPIPVLGSPRPL